MDPVALLARLLLVVGCAGAALVPAMVGAPDPMTVSVAHAVSISVAPVVSEPSSVPDISGVAEELPPAPAHQRSGPVQPWWTGKPAREPVIRAWRFNRAEDITRSPARVHIPVLDVDARVVPVGITAEGEMAAPDDYEEVGWYRYGALPGEAGRAVLAGHLDSKSGPAVFYRLALLQLGDEIDVELAGGEFIGFVVREIVQFPVESVPLEDIFGHIERAELVLITCAGQFQGSRTGYTDRVIVYADPIGTP